MLSLLATLPTFTIYLIITNLVLLIGLFLVIVPSAVKRIIKKRATYGISKINCTENLQKMKVLSRYLEQLESHFSVFFLLTEDLMCIANDKGYFIKVNPAWTNLLGWTTEELVGRPYTDFVHPDDLVDTLECAESLTEQPVFKFRNRYKCKDGSYKRLSWTSSAYTVHGYTYAIARYID